MIVKNDCIHFRGDVPCKPHKASGVHCEDCSEYRPVGMRILIIKLGAIGDVIRTTPLLLKLREEHPDAEVTWLTYSPDVLSRDWVNRILDASIENVEWLKAASFDWLINLDKDRLAIALAQEIHADRKSGFTMDDYGKARPVSEKAEEHKWLTGLWDDVSRANTKHYVQEVFEICGYRFGDEPYILEDKGDASVDWNIDASKPVVGLNTGCGGRWVSRLWPDDYWIELARKCLQSGYEVVLLGGGQEHAKNQTIAQKSGAKYFGHFDLTTFIHLVNQVDLVVTAVTMAMHLAIGLKKKLVLFNNIFNKYEFHLYGRGVILEPEKACDCYYSPECEANCIETLRVGTVFDAVASLLDGRK